MNTFLADDAYRDGYQARIEGLVLSDCPFTNEKAKRGWRTGWSDADHDVIYTEKLRNRDEKSNH